MVFHQLPKQSANIKMTQRIVHTIEGNFVNAESSFYGRVEIDRKTGLIQTVGEPLGEADLIVEKGFIFPGFVDLHIHAREDASGQQTYKEDFESAAQAAAHGGVVCAADMPNNSTAPITSETYLVKKDLCKDKAIDFLLYAGIGPGAKPLSFPVPYKVFMGPSVGYLFFKNFKQLEETIKSYRGCSISFHCENPAMIREDERPPQAEISAIEFALKLIQIYNLRGNICHCSTKEGIEKIREAKRRGARVTCEVTPHHLYFDESMLQGSPPPLLPKKWWRVNPPLRSPKDRKALLKALLDGTIDYLASDHAPHTKEEKEKGLSGMPHLDTYGAFCTWLMAEQNFKPEDIARVCSYNPGLFVNNFSREKCGKIEKGYLASFTILDLETPTIVSAKDLKTKCKWSPFEGIAFPGSVQYTIHRGNILYAKT